MAPAQKDFKYQVSAKGILLSLVLTTSSAIAQVNPSFYFRISKCDNCRTKVYVNETVLTNGACGEGLAWSPILINTLLKPDKNKLRFELKNEKPNEFYGAFTFELLKVDSVNNVFKKFYSHELKLEDFDKFQLNIDNLIKRQGWQTSNQNPEKETLAFVRNGNRKDSLDYFFDKKDRFYLTITAARHATYSVSLNSHEVMAGNLHITAFQDAYAFANYPYFFLNSFDKSSGQVVMNYTLEPQPGKKEAYLEILLYHYPPGAGDPQMLAISKITCPVGEKKKGELDLTEPLKRKGFFNP